MALADLRLALMPFAQRWSGNTLSATLLVLPSGDPTQPLLPGAPPFAGNAIKLRAVVIDSLDALPALGQGADVALNLLPQPVHAVELFELLKTKFAPKNTVGAPSSGSAFSTVRKALPDTYTTLLPPGAGVSSFVGSLDEFGCAMRGQTPPPIKSGPRSTSWGELISYALRNPFLATALGLRYDFTISGALAASLKNGGWLYVVLDPSDSYYSLWNTTQPDAVRCYAARLPDLAAGAPRQVFTAVLFPVANPKVAPATPNEADVDEAIIEAEAYDDGFAKLLHARQPDSLDAHIGDGKTLTPAGTDAGIQIGWDDGQVLVWHNRQLAISAAIASGLPAKFEAPLGVLGYRVDVRVPVPGETGARRNIGWYTLMQASATVPPALQGKIPAFSGELVIEPTPSSPANVHSFWLPLYFAQWRGMPLGTRDDTPHLLAGGVAASAAGVPGTAGAVNLIATALTAQPAPIRLLYGTRYEFRTRLSDLTGGGPLPGDTPINESVSERAAVTFSRWVPPRGLRVATAFDETHVAPHVDRLQIARPKIAYPEALFTRRYGTAPEIAAGAVNAMLAQLGMQPDGTPDGGTPPPNDVLQTGLPDPDVTSLEIIVEVRALAHDRADDVSEDGSFVEVYRTTREVPPLAAIALEAGTPAKPADVVADVAIPPLELDYIDVDQIAGKVAPATGPLPIPRARDVRLRITPLATPPAESTDYFGVFAAGSTRPPVTRGVTSHLLVRAPVLAETEAPLFTPLSTGRPTLEALFFQPVTEGDPVVALMNAMATQLELDVDGMTLRARPGERVVFGATGFKCTISSDGGAITFASVDEILRHWTVALQSELNRDWTWDAASGTPVGVNILPPSPAPIVSVGQIVMPRIASAQAIEGTPDRTATRLVFLHAIDPTVVNDRDGRKNRDPYQFTLTMASESGASVMLSSDPIAVRLPLATNPARIPQLKSAGYALSPYLAADDYSSTAPRHRQLWLEFDVPPDDIDGLFVRLLAYAADPLLYNDVRVRETAPGEPPALKLDPELMRVITPGQSRDDDGLESMVEIRPSTTDPLRYLLPLPDGVDESDPRLFGMWTYELRYGHKVPWSLAHARFGRPSRAAGVQHPAPALPCVAIWQRFDGPINTAARTAPAGASVSPALIPPLRAPTRWQVVVTAPFATPVQEDGRRAGTGLPLTTLGFLLYAQVIQADGSGYRNVLLAHQGATPVDVRDTSAGFAYDYGQAVFGQDAIQKQLAVEGLPTDASLSVLAVEFYPAGGAAAASNEFRRDVHAALVTAGKLAATSMGPLPDPFAPEVFAQRRVLRTSALTKVEPYC